MNKWITNIVVFISILFITYIAYRTAAIIFQPKQRTHIQELEMQIRSLYDNDRDIIIQNDTKDECYLAPDTESGYNQIIRPSETIGRLRGGAHIFVPKMKGWYSIDYPFPYPLATKQEGLMFVVVPLSQLIAATNTGNIEVACAQAKQSDVELEQLLKTAVSIETLKLLKKMNVEDIKVTFEIGDLHKKWLRSKQGGGLK